MGKTSRSRSRSTRALLPVALLLGCGPRVKEDNDDFIEQECRNYCDGVDPCDLGEWEQTWDECFSSCIDSQVWSDSCLEPRAEYNDCLLSLTCEELEDYQNGIVAGEDLSGHICGDALYEASVCRND